MTTKSALPMPNHSNNANNTSTSHSDGHKKHQSDIISRNWHQRRHQRRFDLRTICNGLTNRFGRQRRHKGASGESDSDTISQSDADPKAGNGYRKRNSWDSEIDYAEGQNSVPVSDLFRYANRREIAAAALGALLMLYAASWQPISVFILAIMASLMGQYSKRVQWLHSVNETTANLTTITTTDPTLPIADPMQMMSDQPSHLIADLESTYNHDLSNANGSAALMNRTNAGNYSDFTILGGALQTLVDGLFNRLTGTTGDSSTSSDIGSVWAGGDSEKHANNINQVIENLEANESDKFLRKSFEINATAFLLALTQLSAFFLGMSLIIWMARKQSARIKLLYFDSCLHQEVTWFESIDSAGGSGSSLNSLMDKYEDGIGAKLALLCYFLGHVALFATCAFYQMVQLAAFCLPFVGLVGISIAILSERQAIAIGQQALFSKRSLQLAEEIIAAMRTVYAFNGQQKELTRYSLCLRPVYRKSLVKHLYTALNTSLSKFSIFACFAVYCFYAQTLFPPHSLAVVGSHWDRSTILAVLRGAEVSIVNILISIPFLEALQQSRGSIARIYAAIERRSKIDARSNRGAKPEVAARAGSGNGNGNNAGPIKPNAKWMPTISFQMVQFSYADRCGPTRRRSTLPCLKLASNGNGPARQVPSDLLKHLATDKDDKGRRVADEIIVQECELDKTGSGFVNESGRRVSIVPPVISRRRSSAIARSVAEAVAKVTNKATDDTLTVEQYHGSDLLILNKFNLDIKAGQSVALVGPSGSGKSTVLALVQRLYDITGGQLMIGPYNIKDLNVAWLRNQISVVPQEPRLFDLSIADNIKLGLPNEVLEDRSTFNQADIMQQVVEAAREANAHDFIERLPEGYSTRVGSSAGVQLSGGQKQRIAIARALIRKPKILLLDECTSALDSDSEMQVQSALQRASTNRTTLIVAHRLDTIKHVDLIVVMSGGKVIGCGTHDELMNAAQSATGAANCAGAVSVAGAIMYKQLYEEQMRSLASRESKRKSKRRQSKGQVMVVGSGGGDREKPAAGESAARGVDGDGDDDDDEDEDEDEDEEFDYKDEVYDDDAGSDIVDINCETRPSAPELWRFLEMPKWSALGSCLVCLLGGLILPMNLIAHSYLFNSFAYNEPEQIGNYLHAFGLLMLSFSAFVFIVSFLQVILPGYVGEKLSARLRVKILDSLLSKPMFYFDMPSNSAGAICDRFNGHISSLQNIAGTRSATLLEAVSTLLAGAFFGLGKNLQLSIFCLSFALLVLMTTIVESKLVEQEAQAQQRFDTQLAHLMADALSNIKTIASLNKERFFTGSFKGLIEQRESMYGLRLTLLRTFLTSFKFIMPAMSWSASMYYASRLLTEDQIDLQTIFIVCPVVLFAVNDTFRALVFLPELLRARKSIEQLYKIEQEFSPQTLQTLTLAQQLDQQYQLYQRLQQQQQTLPTGNNNNGNGDNTSTSNGNNANNSNINNNNTNTIMSHISMPVLTLTPTPTQQDSNANDDDGDDDRRNGDGGEDREPRSSSQLAGGRTSGPRLSVSSVCLSAAAAPTATAVAANGSSSASMTNGSSATNQQQHRQDPRRLSAASAITLNAPLPTYLSTDPNGFSDDQSSNNRRHRRTSSSTSIGGGVGGVGGAVAANAAATDLQQTATNNRACCRRRSSRLNSIVPDSQSRGRIEFKNVHFAYPSRPSAPVLNDFTLSIGPGESVAIVGASGSGKSTSVAILEKFYDYHAGQVWIDGRDLRLLEPSWIRQQIGLVSQEPCLLSYTIGDNIRYGDNSRFVNMNEVVQAARAANIHDFIMSLPDQYDTELASSCHSSSCQLSGGQRQRIAIARALIRQAPILIFDEATSALDNRSESLVQDALARARKNRTSLTIAHRLKTVKDSDKIVVLMDGRVVESGKHDELLAIPDGHYRQLWLKQEGSLDATPAGEQSGPGR